DAGHTPAQGTTNVSAGAVLVRRRVAGLCRLLQQLIGYLLLGSLVRTASRTRLPGAGSAAAGPAALQAGLLSSECLGPGAGHPDGLARAVARGQRLDLLAGRDAGAGQLGRARLEAQASGPQPGSERCQ